MIRSEKDQKRHVKTRIKEIENCVDVDALVVNLFPNEEEDLPHNCSKRKSVKEWIECYAKGEPCPKYKHKTPNELALDIYKPEWDYEDTHGLFVSIRKALVKWINNYKNSI